MRIKGFQQKVITRYEEFPQKQTYDTYKWLAILLSFGMLMVSCGGGGGGNSQQQPSPPPSNGAGYYIDYSAPDDSASGRSTDTPWKHCPGDPQATGKAKSTVLSPGDTVYFKGNVTYRGVINVDVQGVPGSPIVFKGDGWGAGRAIINGAEIITAKWTRCSSAADCGGNPNYSNIWYADLPAAVSPTPYSANLHENGEFLYVAQEPNQPDPFFIDNTDYFRQPVGITTTTVTDPFLDSYGATLVGKIIHVYGDNNVTQPRKILSYQGNGTILFDTGMSSVYTGTSARYALANHVMFVDRPGEYVYEEELGVGSTHKTYLWPFGANPNDVQIEISERNNGFVVNNSYITVEGFLVRQAAGMKSVEGTGLAVIQKNNQNMQSIIIRNNIVEHGRCQNNDGAGGIYVGHTKDAIVANNISRLNARHRGILAMNCDNIRFLNNTVRKNGLTGMDFYTCSNSRMVGNDLAGGTGKHANGISIYINCDTILVAFNKIVGCNFSQTFENSKDLTFFGNYYDNVNAMMYVVGNWHGCSGTIRFINNTLVNGKHNAISMPMSATTGDYIFVNNIIDGVLNYGAPAGSQYTNQRWNNLYVGIGDSQSSDHGWTKTPSEIVGSEKKSASGVITYTAVPLENVFTDVIGGDYRLKTDSPAVNSGINPAPFLPVGVFTDFDFKVDMNGVHRPQSTAWDIGAYELVNANQ